MSVCFSLSGSPSLPGRPFSPSGGAAASRWTQTAACPPCRRDACCVHRSSSPSASPEGGARAKTGEREKNEREEGEKGGGWEEN